MTRKLKMQLYFGSFFAIILLTYLTIKLHIFKKLHSMPILQYLKMFLKFKESHILYAIIFFLIIYIILLSISIPMSLWLNLIGGFLFGSILGSSLAIIATTIGSYIIFMLVKKYFGKFVKDRFLSKYKKIEKDITQNGIYYLISLRFIGVFPFWIINLLAGVFHVDNKKFLISTLIGCIPITILQVMIGNNLREAFFMNGDMKISAALNMKILLPFIILGLLIVFSTVIKKVKKRRA